MGMYLVAVACLLLSLGNDVAGELNLPLEVPGTLIFKPQGYSSYNSRSFGNPGLVCSNTYGPICGDCNTLWTCVGEEIPVFTQNCDQMNPGRPLCHNNACVSSVPADSNCAPDLKCTSEGYFPNPTNCSQYYFCEGPKLGSKVYECPPGYAYDTYTTRCRLGKDCVPINCSSNVNQYVAMPENNIYYAYCLNKLGVSSPIMFRCANDFLNHTFFDEEAQKCVFQCPSEGRFIDNENDNAFFECLFLYTDEPSGGHFLVTRQQCIAGLIFDGYRQACRSRYPWE